MLSPCQRVETTQPPKERVQVGIVRPRKEQEDELGIASASRDHSEEMELRELDMRRLPSCVDALTVSDMRSR